LLEDCILQGGVDPEFIKWVPYDGVGRTVRNGLNFTERGFGVRGAVGIPDRATRRQPTPAGDFDWDRILRPTRLTLVPHRRHLRCLERFHAQARDRSRPESQTARHDGFLRLNYRPSLWKSIGGQARAQEVNQEIARHVDVMLGNEEDFTRASAWRWKALTRTCWS